MDDDIFDFFFGLSFLLFFIFLFPKLDRDDDIKRIDKYVFDHDYSLSCSENWDVYLDGYKVNIFGLDLYDDGYNVVFDGYNKIVIVTSKKRYSIF